MKSQLRFVVASYTSFVECHWLLHKSAMDDENDSRGDQALARMAITINQCTTFQTEWHLPAGCIFSCEAIGQRHWKFGWEYERHPFWKVMLHKITGAQKVVQWDQVACRYGHACRRKTCPFLHCDAATEWQIIGEIWRPIDKSSMSQ